LTAYSAAVILCHYLSCMMLNVFDCVQCCCNIVSLSAMYDVERR